MQTKQHLQTKLAEYLDELQQHPVASGYGQQSGLISKRDLNRGWPEDRPAYEALFEFDKYCNSTLRPTTKFNPDIFQRLTAELGIDKKNIAFIRHIKTLLIFYWRYRFNHHNFFTSTALEDWFSEIESKFNFVAISRVRLLSASEKLAIEDILHGRPSTTTLPLDPSLFELIKNKRPAPVIGKLEALHTLDSELSVAFVSPSRIKIAFNRFIQLLQMPETEFDFHQLDCRIVEKLRQCEALPQGGRWLEYLPQTKDWLESVRQAKSLARQNQYYQDIKQHFNAPYPWERLLSAINSKRGGKGPTLNYTGSSGERLESLMAVRANVRVVLNELEQRELTLTGLNPDIQFLLDLDIGLDKNEETQFACLKDKLIQAENLLGRPFDKLLTELIDNQAYESCTTMLLSDPTKANCSPYPELLRAQKLLLLDNIDDEISVTSEAQWQLTPQKIKSKIQTRLQELLKSDVINVRQARFEEHWFYLPEFILNDVMNEQLRLIRHCIDFRVSKGSLNQLLAHANGYEQLIFGWLKTSPSRSTELVEAIINAEAKGAKESGLRLYFKLSPKSSDIIGLIEKITLPNVEPVTFLLLEKFLGSDTQLIHQFLAYLLLPSGPASEQEFIDTCEKLSHNSLRNELDRRWRQVFSDPYKFAVKNTKTTNNLRKLLDFGRSIELIIGTNDLPSWTEDGKTKLGKIRNYLKTEHAAWLKGNYDTYQMVRDLCLLKKNLDDDEIGIISAQLGEASIEFNEFIRQTDILFNAIPLCEYWFTHAHFKVAEFSTVELEKLREDFSLWQTLYTQHRRQLASLPLITNINVWVNGNLSRVGLLQVNMADFEKAIAILKKGDLHVFSELKSKLQNVQGLVDSNQAFFTFIFGKSNLQDMKHYFNQVEESLPKLEQALIISTQLEEREQTVGVNPFNLEQNADTMSKQAEVETILQEVIKKL